MRASLPGFPRASPPGCSCWCGSLRGVSPWASLAVRTGRCTGRAEPKRKRLRVGAGIDSQELGTAFPLWWKPVRMCCVWTPPTAIPSTRRGPSNSRGRSTGTTSLSVRGTSSTGRAFRYLADATASVDSESATRPMQPHPGGRGHRPGTGLRAARRGRGARRVRPGDRGVRAAVLRRRPAQRLAHGDGAGHGGGLHHAPGAATSPASTRARRGSCRMAVSRTRSTGVRARGARRTRPGTVSAARWSSKRASTATCRTRGACTTTWSGARAKLALDDDQLWLHEPAGLPPRCGAQYRCPRSPSSKTGAEVQLRRPTVDSGE
ncbi:hypothetical protein STANM309S_02689 [Streptomyces tanashiensis]